MTVYTIGFTKKTAECFYETIKESKIDLIIDVRLNNHSQLAGFSKYPDIVYFLKEITQAEYIHDEMLSPTDELLKEYKSGNVTWEVYEVIFGEIMEKRDINKHILNEYSKYSDKKICLLCSEPTPDNCHRRLVAKYFKELFKAKIVHL